MGAKTVSVRHAAPIGQDQRLSSRAAERRAGGGDNEQIGGGGNLAAMNYSAITGA